MKRRKVSWTMSLSPVTGSCETVTSNEPEEWCFVPLDQLLERRQITGQVARYEFLIGHGGRVGSVGLSDGLGYRPSAL